MTNRKRFHNPSYTSTWWQRALRLYTIMFHGREQRFKHTASQAQEQ